MKDRLFRLSVSMRFIIMPADIILKASLPLSDPMREK
jgi:hypothetical protein